MSKQIGSCIKFTGGFDSPDFVPSRKRGLLQRFVCLLSFMRNRSHQQTSAIGEPMAAFNGSQESSLNAVATWWIARTRLTRGLNRDWSRDRSGTAAAPDSDSDSDRGEEWDV